MYRVIDVDLPELDEDTEEEDEDTIIERRRRERDALVQVHIRYAFSRPSFYLISLELYALVQVHILPPLFT